MTTKLAHQTQKTAGISNGMRTATIAAVGSDSITITVAGGSFTEGVGVVTSYAPIVGDTVAVFRQDSSWLILGPTSAVNGWQPMSSLGYQNSWVDRSGSPGQWRVTSLGVQIVGQLNNASVPGNGSVIVTGLPAPAGEIIVCIAAQGTTRPALHVDIAGALRIYDGSVTGFLQFCGFYPLDSLTTA
jgi:hypothetical protein